MEKKQAKLSDPVGKDRNWIVKGSSMTSVTLGGVLDRVEESALRLWII